MRRRRNDWCLLWSDSSELRLDEEPVERTMSLTTIGIVLDVLSGMGYLAASFTWRRKWARAAALIFAGAFVLIVSDLFMVGLRAPGEVAHQDVNSRLTR